MDKKSSQPRKKQEQLTPDIFITDVTSGDTFQAFPKDTSTVVYLGIRLLTIASLGPWHIWIKEAPFDCLFEEAA